MILKAPRSHDIEQIYEYFIGAQVSKKDLDKEGPKRGFYEYHLSYDDIAARARMPFSLVMEGSDGKLVGYLLAYSLSHLPKLDNTAHDDPVHDSFLVFDQEVVYIDQIFLHPDYPLPLAGRMLDALEHMIREEGVPGVIGVIPEDPWTNQSSTRLAFARGFSRRGVVKTEDVNLGLFAKPYLPLDTLFEGFGDGLILSGNAQFH